MTKRNVTDVSYVASDLTEQPMRTVLAERKRRATSIPRAMRDAAYRERAGLIGELQSCICAYPVRLATTESGHEDWCLAVALMASLARAKAVTE